jgi:predicted nucleic acid-binding protein
VTALVLDAGALVALERGNRDVHNAILDALRIGNPVRTNANVIAQVWRNGARQARLAKALRRVTIEPITREDGYRAGELMGATRTKDVVDATVALQARSGDRVYTSDPGDLEKLCEATGFKAKVIRC